jgi:hypothetical protein
VLLGGCVVLILGLLGVRAYNQSTEKAKDTTEKAKEPGGIAQERRAPEVEEDSDLVHIRGRVMDPDGKPVAGAAILVLPYSVVGVEKAEPLGRWESGRDGRFGITFRKSQIHPPVMNAATPWKGVRIATAVPGYGPAWVSAGEVNPNTEATLRLVRDDVPLRGRVVTLQGRPVAGVQVHVSTLWATPGEDLTPWLDAFKRKVPAQVRYQFLRWLHYDGAALGIPPVTTGRDGQFVLRGVGRERIAELVLEGPTIAKTTVQAMTRVGEALTERRIPQDPRGGEVTYYGAEFDWVAQPTQPIEGVVKDADTGDPLPGVTVQSHLLAGSAIVNDGFVQTKTDAQGRYRLTGMPKGKGSEIMCVPAAGQPYFMHVVAVPDKPSLPAISVDIKLKRGILIRGRVTDQVTGEPVFADVKYLAFLSNEFASEYPNFTLGRSMHDIQFHYRTAPDGSYQLVGLPGRGLVCAKAFRQAYVLGRGAEAISGMGEQGEFATYWNPTAATRKWWHVMKEINPPAGTQLVEQDLMLDPGQSVEVRFVGPDYQPLTGVEIGNNLSVESPVRSDRVRLPALDPAQPTLMLFAQRQKDLGKAVRIRGDEPFGLTVRLEPRASLKGRLVNSDGLPVAGAEMEAGIPIGDFSPRFPPVTSDQAGRFLYTGLLPGAKYSLKGRAAGYAYFVLPGEVVVAPGQVTDLGDLKVKPEKE